jgi:hypothetical protein
VLCGDLSLRQSIFALPELSTRILYPVTIDKISDADVAALAAGTIFDHPEFMKQLQHAAHRPGGLRNVENVMRNADLFATGNNLSEDHIAAAMSELNLVKRRAS